MAAEVNDIRRQRRQASASLDKHAAEEKALIRAAYRLIDVNGDGPTSLQDILDEAGLSTRAFYRIFNSKDELLVRMYRIDSQRFLQELHGAVAAHPRPPDAASAWIDHWVNMLYDPRRDRHVRVLSSTEARNAEGMRAANTESHNASIAVLTQVMSAGLASGDFPIVEPAHDARVFQAAVVELLQARLFREFTVDASDASDHLHSLMGRAVGCALPRDAAGPV